MPVEYLKSNVPSLRWTIPSDQTVVIHIGKASLKIPTTLKQLQRKKVGNFSFRNDEVVMVLPQCSLIERSSKKDAEKEVGALLMFSRC